MTRSPHRRRPTVAAAVLMALATACSAGSGTGTQTERGAVRPGGFDFCPDVTVPALPPGLTLRDRTLPNLGGGTLGRVVEYGDGQRTISVHIGEDPLEALEDLDFEAVALPTAGRGYTVSTTHIDTGLVVASWEDESFGRPCGEVAVMGRGFSVAELAPVLDSVSLAYRPAGEKD